MKAEPLLSSIRYDLFQTQLKGWSLIEVTGVDRIQFLQGQLTNDIQSLPVGEFQYTARLNRTGKLQSYFILGKREHDLVILCESVLAEHIQEDLNKFIIMDDVELKKTSANVFVIFNSFLNTSLDSSPLLKGKFFGVNSAISFSEAMNVPFATESEVESIRIKNGYPLWEKDLQNLNFINDSILNEVGISYKKGCFLGQETAAKIENNRGAAYYPVYFLTAEKTLIPSDDFSVDGKKAGKINYQLDGFIQANLIRDYRVEGKKLTIEVAGREVEVTTHYLPFYKAQSRKEIGEELYHKGVELFQQTRVDEAMDFMKRSIAFSPDYSDAYESIGVILGRQERYDEAIAWMNKLLEVSPSSVMAHTNKSLFLMKQGKIEEAEAEKGLATVKSFAVFGEEAKLKKALEEEKKKKEEDINRREKMFLQVLDIDEEDPVALFGMGDIAFYREDFKTAVSYLEKVVKVDEKYSVAYLSLGKSLEATGNLERAMQVYKKGIDVASKRGDMMPANEMQSRLNQLVMISGLA